MEVDKHKETRKYYNCGKIGYLTVRYSKLKKKRREKVRIIDNVMEDFSLDKE